MERFFRKGLRDFKAGKASPRLQACVKKYHKTMEDAAKRAAERKYIMSVHREMREELNAFAVKLKEKFATKFDRAGHRGKQIASAFRVIAQSRAKTSSRRPLPSHKPLGNCASGRLDPDHVRTTNRDSEHGQVIGSALVACVQHLL